MPTGIYKHNPLSEEHKKNISKSLKQIGHIPPNWKGKKRSIKMRTRLSKTNSGSGGSNWQGGKLDESSMWRKRIEYRLWREAVFARDNWTCQKYGIKGGRLHPHHIKNFSQYPELRFSIDNGITLSEKAHKEFHKKYGRKNNTKEQLLEFLKD